MREKVPEKNKESQKERGRDRRGNKGKIIGENNIQKERKNQ